MAVTHEKKFGIYHWDTFDNETLLIDEADTLSEATKIVEKKYAGRLNFAHGADQVDIVDRSGKIVKVFKVC